MSFTSFTQKLRGRLRCRRPYQDQTPDWEAFWPPPSALERAKPQIGDDGGTSSVVFFGSRGIVVGDDTVADELPAIWHTGDAGTHWQVVHPVVS